MLPSDRYDGDGSLQGVSGEVDDVMLGGGSGVNGGEDVARDQTGGFVGRGRGRKGKAVLYNNSAVVGRG